MSEYVISMIRTIIPMLVGVVATKLVSLGWHFDEATMSSVMVLFFSGGYYAFARWMEEKHPQVARWLLGVNKPPSYDV